MARTYSQRPALQTIHVLTLERKRDCHTDGQIPYHADAIRFPLRCGLIARIISFTAVSKRIGAVPIQNCARYCNYTASLLCANLHAMPWDDGITQCYLPSDRSKFPTSPQPTGTRLSDPRWLQGRVDLVGCLHTEMAIMVYPPKDGHPSY